MIAASADDIPVIDITTATAAQDIVAACTEFGFFAIQGHGIDDGLRRDLLDVAQAFFNQSPSTKQSVAMTHGGSAWRGWCPLEGELTSGIPDLKEGFYVGRELDIDPRPMHGPNLWPQSPAQFRPAVERWMTEVEALGQRVLALMAVGLGLDDAYFVNGLTNDPTPLFRIFRYPPQPVTDDTDRWGVAEHSDYGLLTLLAHDGTPGLEVQVGEHWVEAPSDPELIMCNLGDMLDRLTRGRFRSTPHRVRNHSSHDRYSMPFFLDPGWDAVVNLLPIDPVQAESDHDVHARERWDQADLDTVSGTYGDWLTMKVRNVFPHLAAQQFGPPQ